MEIQEQTIEKHIKNISSQLIWMQEQMHHFKRQVGKPVIKKIVDEVYDAECQRLETLRDEAVRALRLLVDKGVIGQEELNEAVRK